MRILSCLAVAFLALACANLTEDDEPTSRVLPHGEDRFEVSYGPLWDVDQARRAAIDDANRFCGTRNALMVPDSERTPYNATTSFQLIFHCEPEHDPR